MKTKNIALALALAVLVALCAVVTAARAGQTPLESEPEITVTEPPAATSAPTETPAPATETPTPTQEPAAPERFTITMVGDCTFDTVAAYRGTEYGYDAVIGGDWSYPFAETIEYFADDDFSMANLEVVLSDSDTAATAKTFTFRASSDYANILSCGSIEFATIANNHILDYGQTGYDDTKAALDAVGVAYAGCDEYAVYETESGLSIGVYAVSFGTTAQIQAGIAALQELDCDFIIAALHWGDEGSYSPNSTQISQGRAAIDAGADIVYGSHPHTLQPVEEYNGGYIYYSLGNWSFGGNTDPRDKDTVILRLMLERGENGEVSITQREHIPCACSGVESGNNYQPVPYEDGSEGYLRVLSKLDGTYSGGNLSIDYSYSANE